LIRLFNVHYPVRTLVLLVGEALIVGLSFVAAMLLVESREYGLLQLSNELFIENGYLKLLAVIAIVLLVYHGFDLYDPPQGGSNGEQTFRVMFVLGLVVLALVPVLKYRPSLLPGGPAAGWGVIILVFALFGWRAVYAWLVRQRFFREKVYVLGAGERAQRLLNGLRQRSDLGIEVVGWTGNIEGELSRLRVAADLMRLVQQNRVHRVIVTMADRRGTVPVEELLQLRMRGVKVEEATDWLEKISGKIEVEQLYPSWLIFADGFRFSGLVRRFLNFSMALVGLILSLPLWPFIVLALKLDSRGPVLYRQKRVGRLRGDLANRDQEGTAFYCLKFRTMRRDAEADTGATWALDDDPRITRVGKVLRALRLDEIPQLWCVLKGDMNFVGPRPERPEFVEWLNREIPYYWVRHVARPGITGWAQVQYKYGNTLEDAREKLQYDLFYIKNASIGLDLWIWFQTVKIVLLGRGAQ
jgi:sugar transferase (PEP-CTERM system associated)